MTLKAQTMELADGTRCRKMAEWCAQQAVFTRYVLKYKHDTEE